MSFPISPFPLRRALIYPFDVTKTEAKKYIGTLFPALDPPSSSTQSVLKESAWAIDTLHSSAFSFPFSSF
jgi:hypothetical protein